MELGREFREQRVRGHARVELIWKRISSRDRILSSKATGEGGGGEEEIFVIGRKYTFGL
jgi:hypothetical protein